MTIAHTERWRQFVHLVDSIDLQHIMDTIDEFAGVSITAADTEGVTRLAYSDLDIKARNRIITLMRDAGLNVRVAPIGNIFGKLTSRCPDKPVILVGSHSDSVVNGGRYDGVMGLICAIEATRVLHNIKDELTYPIEVVDFAMEESSRFGGDYGFGSHVMVGEVIQENRLLRTDKNGVTLAAALQNIKRLNNYPRLDDSPSEILAAGFDLIARSQRSPEEIKVYLEMHIEQSVTLEEQGVPIGAVTGAATPTRWEIILTGEQSHSGTTPMRVRRNPLLAAAEIVLLADKLCKEQETQGKGTVGAITTVKVEPNVQNIVPGKCTLLLDLRGPNQVHKEQVLHTLNDEINRGSRSICARYDVECTINWLANEKPIQFSSTICEAIEESCTVLEIPSIRIHSRAGHDACHIAQLVKECGMIFLPSRKGISHHRDEYTAPEDIFIGAKVLLLTLLQLAIE